MNQGDDFKRCLTCNEKKPFSDFGKHSRFVDGLRPTCRKCRNKGQRIVRSADYETMLIAQNNKCGICSVDANDVPRRFSVDHDHNNDQIRGLLCSNCNVLIGMASDDTTILELAIAYLKHYEVQVID